MELFQCASMGIAYGIGKCLRCSAAPTELLFFLSVCTQGFISGFALISPWAMQECRAYGTRN